MQRRESAQRVPRFCRGSAGELRQPRLSVRGVATLAMILPPPLVRLIPPAANWPGGCPRLSTSGPAAPRAWVCVSGGFLELYRPDSPLDSRREDLAALILELAFSLAPTHSMSMRSPPSVGDPRVCDLKFGLKDCVNLCPHVLAVSWTLQLVLQDFVFDKLHQANSPLRSSPSRRLLCLLLHLAQQHASGCRTSSSRDRSTLSSCTCPDSSSVTKALVWQVVPIALLRRSLTCALWSRQGCRRKARRGNMAVCPATREHVFHAVP